MTPHICEELWERLGHTESVFRERLPVADPAYAASEQITLVVQINSKIRARIEIDADTPRDQLEELALANERIQELVGGKTPRKVIVVPNKLVNIIL
jgi:leucyl-tRNA synthetase